MKTIRIEDQQGLLSLEHFGGCFGEGKGLEDDLGFQASSGRITVNV